MHCRFDVLVRGHGHMITVAFMGEVVGMSDNIQKSSVDNTFLNVLPFKPVNDVSVSKLPDIPNIEQGEEAIHHGMVELRKNDLVAYFFPV